MKYKPSFDKDFFPIGVAIDEFEKQVNALENEILKIAVERDNGYNFVYQMKIFADKSKSEQNYVIAERLIKAVLWVTGGYKIYICGPQYIYEGIKNAYTPNGERAFDYDFMSGVYERPMEVVSVDEASFPKEKRCALKIGGHLDGCRIGFDAGGSDRKVSAVVDGKVVYSEEVVWQPKLESDYHYHVSGILDSINRAKEKMPRVDAIGVSTAGVCIDNKVMVSSLFLKIPKEYFHTQVKTMYLNVAKSLNVPIEVANDGDVTALSGAMELNDGGVLGIAMGTSEAGGYINLDGNLNGWISELAFVPVDMNKDSMKDEWSGDIGCGVKYFSQDAIIKLAENSGISFDSSLSPAEKLKVVQDLMENGNATAEKIYEDVGIYLGYTLPFYSRFYQIKHLLLLGRVTSGKGGSVIMKTANKILRDEYPELKISIEMPDEQNKRVGQSIAAASLTEIR